MSDTSVGIVVPVYNGADYLEECLASIVCQTHSNWQAVVVNNHSTDDTRSIADAFARRDSRVRAVHCDEFMGQAENYNRAVALAPDGSRFIKIIEADNWIMPECVSRMLDVAEADPKIGIVGSYYLKGQDLRGGGIPYHVQILPGREVCRMHLLTDVYFLGTPTTLLFRAEALREAAPCFQPGLFYDDVDLCFRLLRRWNFGFVHQILSFLRVDNNGLMSRYEKLDFGLARLSLLVQQYGSMCLTPDEMQRLQQTTASQYLRQLGGALLKHKDRDYWQFHRQTFSVLGKELRLMALLGPAGLAFLDLALNPKRSFEIVVRRIVRGKENRIARERGKLSQRQHRASSKGATGSA